MSIPPSPPNPHIAVMPAPLDKRYQPQYVTSQADAVKLVEYPFNMVNEFSITCYTGSRAKDGDIASLFHNGKLLSEAPVNSGEALTFGNFTYYPLNVKFTVDPSLTSPDIKVTMPLELFGSSGGKDLYFRFGEFADPNTEQLV